MIRQLQSELQGSNRQQIYEDKWKLQARISRNYILNVLSLPTTKAVDTAWVDLLHNFQWEHRTLGDVAGGRDDNIGEFLHDDLCPLCQ